MEKIAWDGPKWGREGLFPTNPDLANILGDMDLDVDNYHFLFLGFQLYGFPGSQISKIWPGPARGRGPGLSHMDHKVLVFWCKY